VPGKRPAARRLRLNGTTPAAMTRQQPRIAARADPAAAAEGVGGGCTMEKQAADVICISDDSDG
jgi:hypothetical protein